MDVAVCNVVLVESLEKVIVFGGAAETVSKVVCSKAALGGGLSFG